MVQILLSSPISDRQHLSLSVPHCVHARDPPLLYHPPLGTCVTQRLPLRTWYRSSFPLPSQTENMCHSASPTAYLPEILLSCTIPHWGHVSVSVPHCIPGTYSSILPYPPIRTLISEHPPLRTCQRSPSLPPSPTGNMCHSASPTAYMPEILLSSTVPHWGHVSVSVPTVYMVQILLFSPIPHYGHVSLSVPLWYMAEMSSPSPTGDMCH